MKHHLGMNAGAQMLGEFTETADTALPPATHRGMSLDVHSFVEFEPESAVSELLREFTVLLADRSIVKVRGHEIKCISNDDQNSNVVIVEHSRHGDVIVGLFPATRITGVFSGIYHLSGVS